MKEMYDIKINRGYGFKYEGSGYFNAYDSDEQKDIEIKKIRKKYNLKGGEYLNISNLFNIYC